MRLRTAWRWGSLGGLMALMLGVVPAAATPELMQRLPTTQRFACLICHQTATPTDRNLNSFGLAFEANGSRWDAKLARESSDSDGCTNGFELRDENGDGLPDAELAEERYNPGSDDCPLQINETAWSALKKIFR